MKTYNAPTLVEYGQVGALTGVFGSEMVADQSFDPQGNEIPQNAGEGSINQCATGNNQNCL